MKKKFFILLCSFFAFSNNLLAKTTFLPFLHELKSNSTDNIAKVCDFLTNKVPVENGQFSQSEKAFTFLYNFAWARRYDLNIALNCQKAERILRDIDNLIKSGNITTPENKSIFDLITKELAELHDKSKNHKITSIDRSSSRSKLKKLRSKIAKNQEVVFKPAIKALDLITTKILTKKHFSSAKQVRGPLNMRLDMRGMLLTSLTPGISLGLAWLLPGVFFPMLVIPGLISLELGPALSIPLFSSIFPKVTSRMDKKFKTSHKTWLTKNEASLNVNFKNSYDLFKTICNFNKKESQPIMGCIYSIKLLITCQKLSIENRGKEPEIEALYQKTLVACSKLKKCIETKPVKKQIVEMLGYEIFNIKSELEEKQISSDFHACLSNFLEILEEDILDPYFTNLTSNCIKNFQRKLTPDYAFRKFLYTLVSGVIIAPIVYGTTMPLLLHMFC